MSISIEELVATLIGPRNRRLTFDEQCSYYAAMQMGLPPTVIAEAAGVSVTAAIYLRAAGRTGSGIVKYPAVAERFRAMGKKAFCDLYLTDPIKDRLHAAHSRVNAKRLEPRKRIGVNRNASRHQGLHAFEGEGEAGVRVIVEWLSTPRPGWFWRVTHRHGAAVNESAHSVAYQTSKAAFDNARLRFAPTDDEVMDGSMDKAMEE